jgi:hypothetical protein
LVLLSFGFRNIISTNSFGILRNIVSTKNFSLNGQKVSELWPFKVSPKVGECGKLESRLNFDKTVPNEKIWIPWIHIVAAVHNILILKQFLVVFCISNVKKVFFSVNEKCCKT